MNYRNQKWIANRCAVVACLVLGTTTVFAEDLKPGEALDESKVGIAAKFLPIKAGEFEMGCDPDADVTCETDETRHTVKLTEDFEIQATAVTQYQYFLVTGLNPSTYRKKENCDKNNYQVRSGLGLCIHHPVENVSWDDAQKFIAELNKVQNDYLYRLPTEAEREYAARGGTPSRFPYFFGFNDTNDLDNYAWYAENSNDRTHAVALKNANPYGLYDILGNVREWVQDFYDYYPKGSVTNPTGPATGSNRAVRSGSWNDFADRSRSASRDATMQDNRNSFMGFRLARTRK